MNRPIRVVYFIAEYHRLGGGQRVLLELIRHLPPDVVEPIAVFPGEGQCVETYQKAGVRVEVFPAPEELNRFGKVLLNARPSDQARLFVRSLWAYNAKVARAMKTWGGDIFHCNTSRAVFLAGFGARRFSIPNIWHLRGRLVGSRVIRWLPQLLATRIVLVCDGLRRQVHPSLRYKCLTVYDGVSESGLDAQEKTAAEIPPQSVGRPIISRMSAVAPSRGHHYLVEAASILKQRYSGLQPCFLFVGATPDQLYLDYLQRLVAKHQLENVYFLGWKDAPASYYQRSTIVVCSSVEQERLEIDSHVVSVEGNEGFPRNVAEAMFLGKPVVTTDIAGAAELVGDGTGVIVPQRDAEALAQALINLLSSPARCQEMGRRAAERVRRLFSTERMVCEMVGLYRQLVS